jgi:hypothetical protein
MTPKEKAAELVDEMYNSALYVASKYAAKQCALVAVDEILNAHLFDLDEKQYWQQVRTEIANL